MEMIARVLKMVERWCFFTAQIALAFMMLSISYDAIARYVFAAPTQWSFEINGFLMIYIAMIPASDLLRRHSHLNVEFISLALRGRIAWFQRVAIAVIGLTVSVILTHYTYNGAHEAWMYSERMPTTLGTPMVLPKAMLPFGFAMLALRFLASLLSELGLKEFASETEAQQSEGDVSGIEHTPG